MSLEIHEPCLLWRSAAAVANAFSTLIAITPEPLRPEHKRLYQVQLTQFDQHCACHDGRCKSEFEVVREWLSRIREPKPRALFKKFDLGKGRLKDFLDKQFKTLPYLGPIDQIPCRLDGHYHFICPACFAKCQKFADMRRHLRVDHEVEKECLDELFPLDTTTHYIRCFGKFTPAEVEANGMIRNPHTTPKKRSRGDTRSETSDKMTSKSSVKRGRSSAKQEIRPASICAHHTIDTPSSFELACRGEHDRHLLSSTSPHEDPENGLGVTETGALFPKNALLGVPDQPPLSDLTDTDFALDQPRLANQYFGNLRAYNARLQDPNDHPTVQSRMMPSGSQPDIQPDTALALLYSTIQSPFPVINPSIHHQHRLWQTQDIQNHLTFQPQPMSITQQINACAAASPAPDPSPSASLTYRPITDDEFHTGSPDDLFLKYTHGWPDPDPDVNRASDTFGPQSDNFGEEHNPLTRVPTICALLSKPERSHWT